MCSRRRSTCPRSVPTRPHAVGLAEAGSRASKTGGAVSRRVPLRLLRVRLTRASGDSSGMGAGLVPGSRRTRRDAVQARGGRGHIPDPLARVLGSSVPRQQLLIAPRPGASPSRRDTIPELLVRSRFAAQRGGFSAVGGDRQRDRSQAWDMRSRWRAVHLDPCGRCDTLKAGCPGTTRHGGACRSRIGAIEDGKRSHYRGRHVRTHAEESDPTSQENGPHALAASGAGPPHER